VCSGHLVRYPLGGHSWHHLQYLKGFEQLGHRVTFFEHYGWPDSCYDPATNEMTSDPSYGIRYVRDLVSRVGLEADWCYLAEDGTAIGLTRAQLESRLRECDLYVNLSNINWIPELQLCRRRVLVDTDPVFTQIGAFGMDGAFEQYHACFTYGENIGQGDCEIPTKGITWQPTRQPVVLGLWPVPPFEPDAPLTTVMSWSGFGEREHKGRIFGHKDREFAPFFDLPRTIGEDMQLALVAPDPVREELRRGGWTLRTPLEITRTPWTYQQFIAGSAGEFCVAKQAYVSTRSGWFSDRSTAYLAMGRPVVVQDTGFTRFLPSGKGILAFETPGEAVERIRELRAEHRIQSQAARAVVQEFFDSDRVLGDLIARATVDVPGLPSQPAAGDGGPVRA
jgi:hypothetical protein